MIADVSHWHPVIDWTKAKQNSENLQKIEQLKEAHKYVLQMMRRGMYY